MVEMKNDAAKAISVVALLVVIANASLQPSVLQQYVRVFQTSVKEIILPEQKKMPQKEHQLMAVKNYNARKKLMTIARESKIQ